MDDASNSGHVFWQRIMTMQEKIAYRGLTFDDVLLEPGYSELMPSELDISSTNSRNHPQCADRQQSDGYGHGKRDGDRDGPARRHRDYSQNMSIEQQVDAGGSREAQRAWSDR
jgi:hypothetical protein